MTSTSITLAVNPQSKKIAVSGGRVMSGDTAVAVTVTGLAAADGASPRKLVLRLCTPCGAVVAECDSWTWTGDTAAGTLSTHTAEALAVFARSPGLCVLPFILKIHSEAPATTSPAAPASMTPLGVARCEVYAYPADGASTDGSSAPTAVMPTSAALAAALAAFTGHAADRANPHTVTKAQVGLGNVDNLSKDQLGDYLDDFWAVDIASAVAGEAALRSAADTALQAAAQADAQTRADAARDAAISSAAGLYYPKADTYTKSEVASLIAGVYRVKGSKTVSQLLALTDPAAGDVYNLTDAGTIPNGPGGASVNVRAGDNVVRTSDGHWDPLSSLYTLPASVARTNSAQSWTAKQTFGETAHTGAAAFSGGVTVGGPTPGVTFGDRAWNAPDSGEAGNPVQFASRGWVEATAIPEAVSQAEAAGAQAGAVAAELGHRYAIVRHNPPRDVYTYAAGGVRIPAGYYPVEVALNNTRWYWNAAGQAAGLGQPRWDHDNEWVVPYNGGELIAEIENGRYPEPGDTLTFTSGITGFSCDWRSIPATVHTFTEWGQPDSATASHTLTLEDRAAGGWNICFDGVPTGLYFGSDGYFGGSYDESVYASIGIDDSYQLDIVTATDHILPPSAFPVFALPDGSSTPLSWTSWDNSPTGGLNLRPKEGGGFILGFNGGYDLCTFTAAGAFDELTANITDLEFNGVDASEWAGTLGYVPVGLTDRAVNAVPIPEVSAADTSVTLALPAPVKGKARDLIADLDNSANTSDYDCLVEFDGLYESFAPCVKSGETLADITAVAGGAKARLLITETALTDANGLPVIEICRYDVEVQEPESGGGGE